MVGGSILSSITLGLYDGPSGGAAVLRDGMLLSIAEEDRLVRKHRVSGLPRAAVQTVLRESGVSPEKIGMVIVATRDATYAEGVGSSRLPFLYRVGASLPSVPVSRMIRDSFASSRRRRIDEALRSEFGISCPVRFLDHHLIHAIGSAYASGFSDCLAITIDGGADGAWAQVTSFRSWKPEVLARSTGPRSLLHFLDEVCEVVGIPEGLDRYHRLEDLGASGTRVHYEQLEPGLAHDDGEITVSGQLFRSGGTLAKLRASSRKEDVAASALHRTADVVREYVDAWCRRTNPEALALGGDLFEIPSLFAAVLENADLPNAVVSPVAGDVGLPVGAAYAGCLPGLSPDPSPIPDIPLPTPFLGISFEEEAIERALASERFDFRKEPEIERDVARVLAEGRTVARFEGRTEIGNRGLGNRAVLRSPLRALRRGRVGFVLGPGAYHTVVLEEAFPTLFYGGGLEPSQLRYAPVLVRPRSDFRERCADLIGWEGLARVQTVSEESNPQLFRILEEFHTWTGIPCLAVAPFRLPDEPLVSSPRDALRTFRLLGAEYAALGRYLVRDPQRQPTPDWEAPSPDRIRQS